jgi:DNA-binding NtrC family response regulator
MASNVWIKLGGIAILFYHMDPGELKTRLCVLLSACQQANTAADPRPMLGLVTREMAALAAMLDPPRIVGESPQIQNVRRTIENIRASSACVLITGGPGTGKELAAAVIHHTSLRSRGPWVVVRSRGGTTSLAETFRHARGGTLFLGEVSDLSPVAQREILRGLDDAETDVRFLAATARDLEIQTARGAFRRDLYYRLKVIHIAMPALSEIAEDIPRLANYFLERCCAEAGRDPAGFPPGLIGELVRRRWPGNSGQLEAEVRRRVTGGELKEAVDHLEKQMVEQALEAANRNQCQAAKSLGLSRQGLINKMKRYGL